MSPRCCQFPKMELWWRVASVTNVQVDVWRCVNCGYLTPYPRDLDSVRLTWQDIYLALEALSRLELYRNRAKNVFYILIIAMCLLSVLLFFPLSFLRTP